MKTLIWKNIKELLAVFMAFAMMVTISGLFVVDIVQNDMEANAREILTTAETRIMSKFREVEVTTLQAVISIRNRLESNQSKEEIEYYMHTVNVGLSPDSGDSPTSLMFMGGYIRNEMYVGLEWTPAADYKPLERPWYIASREAAGGMAFSGPYPDARTGSMVISFSKNISVDNGPDYGVLFCDMNLSEITNYIASLQSPAGGYGMLTTGDGTIVSYPDEYFFGRSIEEISDIHRDVIKKLISERPEYISNINITNSKGEAMVAFFKRMSNGWYVGISTPVNSYYRSTYVLVTVLSLMGLGMAVFLSVVLIRLSRDKVRSEEENIGKSAFLARMSHEIRTPLNTIMGMSELIMRKEISHDIFDYISVIQQAGSNLLAIINDILDFSKIEAGQMNIVFEKYYVASFINDVVNVIRGRLMGKHLEFAVKVDSHIPARLIGDEVHTKQIALNLLSNAIKYTQSGHVTFDMNFEETGDGCVRLVFTVADSGIGIKQKDMDKLFRDFVRVENSKVRTIEGTGLGLSIARSYCRAMDGDISVTSTYGVGSIFTATVIHMLDAESAEEKLARVDGPEKLRVLVFEERLIYLNSLVYALTNLGVNPVSARSLAEFNREMESNAYDYAFLPARHFIDCVYFTEKSNRTKLVSMVELGDVPPMRDISYITMPVLCLGVANILNGAGSETGEKRRLNFQVSDVKVLVVDDISTNLRVAKELLAFYGMDVHTSMNGPDAVNLARSNRYAMIFMDHMMPGMDGLEATALIRAIDKNDVYYRDVPIVALTANAISGQREMFLQNGINDFLAKPIEMEKLEAILQKWLPAEKLIYAPDEADDDMFAAPDSPETLEIEGVSVSSGLVNSGGSLAAYMDILLDFCTDADERAEQIEKSAETGDVHLYMILVHALKSASRNVGAMEFGDFAARMEEAAQNGEADRIANETGKLLENLRALTDGIREALERQTSGGNPNEDMDLAGLHLEEMKTALIGMDITKVNHLMRQYIEMPLSPNVGKALSQIEHHILMFEYDEAIEKIDSLMARNQQAGGGAFPAGRIDV
ncbi:MAG: response regulator [Candidatus Accumulibacter sp.]|nr:response regulator [Accumulibacter sp.]